MKSSVLSSQFRATPYWWEVAPPVSSSKSQLDNRYDAVIVGSGFTGLCCAIELAENGLDVLVVDAGELSIGGSSRSGGMVTGGQKFIVSQALKGVDDTRRDQILEDARESLLLFEERIERYKLDAEYHRYGRVLLAAVPGHMQRLLTWKGLFETQGKASVELLSRDQLSNEVGGRRYHGGLLIHDYGGIHPAKYSQSLRNQAEKLGVTLLSHAAVSTIVQNKSGFLVVTTKGDFETSEVFIGTNGYTRGDALPYLRRRLVPVVACVVATEELPEGLASRLIPNGRMLSDTRKSLSWMRLTPDGKRMMLGAVPSGLRVDESDAAQLLHRRLHSIWPEMADVKIEFCWTGNVGMTGDHIPHVGVQRGVHFAVGCNGSGVAMMSYLGYQVARKILGKQNRPTAFDSSTFPVVPLYNGDPWFLPIVAKWYEAQDKFAALRGR